MYVTDGRNLFELVDSGPVAVTLRNVVTEFRMVVSPGDFGRGYQEIVPAEDECEPSSSV